MFDKLLNLEQQHDVHIKTHTALIVPDEDAPPAAHQNPIIPNNAIVFKKRAADDDSFARPKDKWQKYDLDDVNEHHLSGAGNRHALNDFFRTRVKPSETKVTEEPIEAAPVFKRPMKKEILSNQDEDDDQQPIAIRAPLPPSTVQKSSTAQTADDNDDDDAINAYRLKSTQKKARGVFSTNKKQATKVPMEISSNNEKEVDDDDDDEIDDELFEP